MTASASRGRWHWTRPSTEPHIAVTKEALHALPGIDAPQPGRTVLIRADGAGGTEELPGWLARPGLSCPVGHCLPATTPALYRRVPDQAWQAAVDADGLVRDGAGVVDLTNVLACHGQLGAWPPGMRVIVRRERPHSGRSYGSTRSTGIAWGGAVRWFPA